MLTVADAEAGEPLKQGDELTTAVPEPNPAGLLAMNLARPAALHVPAEAPACVLQMAAVRAASRASWDEVICMFKTNPKAMIP
jgi:hypothetical protein